MRIACIHIPQFGLQCATRLDPSLRGVAVAVVGGGERRRDRAGAAAAGSPVVHACSRAAWALGVRLGMTATAARGLSPAVQVVTEDAGNERETVRAIADLLLGVAAAVDVGGRVGAGGAHLALYCEVPAKTRGTSFGERVLELLDELGLTARIGIADDRFTAWVAAANPAGLQPAIDSLRSSNRPAAGVTAFGDDTAVVSVPRGGSAAFLAPRPLSLLAISPEVQHMLEALGVRTLGEFAALPAPSVTRPFEADFQALARGESDAILRPYTPEAPIREQITVSAGAVLELQDLLPAGEHAGGLSIAGAIALVSRRIALRLSGRGRAAARLEISTGEGADMPFTLAGPLRDEDELAHVLVSALASTTAEPARARGVWQLRVIVVGEAVVEASARGETQDMVGGSVTAEVATAPQVPCHGIDPLTVVLSSPGSLFAQAAPAFARSGAERRDSHRRLRRGKQRRSRSASPPVQPRLFDRTSSS